MSKNLSVNGNNFSYPEAGDPPGWGEGASNWADEVTEVLNTLSNVNNVLETTFILTNGQTTPANVTDLVFSTSSVRAAEIDYSVYITTDSEELTETGKLVIAYSNVSGTWDIAQYALMDDSGIEFSILNSGQVQYTTTTIAGTGYSGTLKFKAKVLTQ